MTIKEIRQKTGLSQSEFAKATGIPVGTIHNWEQGIRTPPEYLPVLIKKALKHDKFL